MSKTQYFCLLPVVMRIHSSCRKRRLENRKYDLFFLWNITKLELQKYAK